MAYEEVLEIAKSAGGIIMRYYGKDVAVRSKSEVSYDPVTTADLEADAYIREELSELYPGSVLLTEEGPPEGLDYKKDVWIVDPLDGTKEFVRGGTDFSVMIALLSHGRLSFGVVYAPFTRKLYYAEAGHGAFIIEEDNRMRIHVSERSSLGVARQVVRAQHTSRNMLDMAIASLDVESRMEMSSIGLRLCAIAENKADFYINTIIVNKWDTAAGEAILSEAGGRITDFDGNGLDYQKEDVHWDRSFVASNGRLHDAAMGLIPDGAFSKMREIWNTPH